MPVLFGARQTSTVARIRKVAVFTPLLLLCVASLLISSGRLPANRPSSCICVYILSPFNESQILCHMMVRNQSNFHSFGQLHNILISDSYIPISRWGRNVGWGCLRIGCWGEHLGLRGTRLQGNRENYIMRTLGIRTPYPILCRW